MQTKLLRATAYAIQMYKKRTQLDTAPISGIHKKIGTTSMTEHENSSILPGAKQYSTTVQLKDLTGALAKFSEVPLWPHRHPRDHIKPHRNYCVPFSFGYFPSSQNCMHRDITTRLNVQHVVSSNGSRAKSQRSICIRLHHVRLMTMTTFGSEINNTHRK